MPIMMLMEWKGFTPAQYDDALQRTNIEKDPPTGLKYHVVGFEGDTIRVTDVWDSAEQFQQFVDSRLMPTIQSMGITSQPDVKIVPAHHVLAP